VHLLFRIRFKGVVMDAALWIVAGIQAAAFFMAGMMKAT
jgi:hypothetical protein